MGVQLAPPPIELVAIVEEEGDEIGDRSMSSKTMYIIIGSSSAGVVLPLAFALLMYRRGRKDREYMSPVGNGLASSMRRCEGIDSESDNDDRALVCVDATLSDTEGTSRYLDDLTLILRYTHLMTLQAMTSIKDQRITLLLTNCDGQNILHLECIQGDLRLLERLLECRTLPGVKIAKALELKDNYRFDAFTSTIASDSCEIVEHLLATRLEYESWFTSGGPSRDPSSIPSGGPSLYPSFNLSE